MSMQMKNVATRVAERTAMAVVLTLGVWLGTATAQAADLPLAAGSPTAGIAFDDRPLLLPVQRNFQMAMLTASSELGRSCGHMEAYGWRMEHNEQARVNQIFNNTVDRMRAQGFAVEAKAPTSVSHDITMFTADRPDKNLVFMWSAGEIGLVMVLCETSPPLTGRAGEIRQQAAALPPQVFPEPMARGSESLPPKPDHRDFSPVGDWVGSYTCLQGTTGATLRISKVHGAAFEGQFRFYPTPKNPYVPAGRYAVSGEYDRENSRILINPGKWLQRPANYTNTIIIGSFNPVNRTFSGYFQGIMGCTSFEARYSVDSAEIGNDMPELKKAAHKKPVKAKKTTKRAKVSAAKPVEPVKAEAPAVPVPAAAVVAPAAANPDVSGIAVGQPTQEAPTPPPALAAPAASPPVPAAPKP